MKMHYDKYEKILVVERGVELINWPDDIPFVNASKITTIHTLQRLMTALTLEDIERRCHWVKLSEEEWKKRKEVYFENETTSKKHQHKTKKVSDDSDDEEGKSDEEQRRPTKKKRVTNTTMPTGKENTITEGAGAGAGTEKGKGKGKPKETVTWKGKRKVTEKGDNRQMSKRTPLATQDANPRP